MQASSLTFSPHSGPIPHIYSPSFSTWKPLSDQSSSDLSTIPLQRGTIIRVISWNIDFSIPAHSERTTTALNYLPSLMTPSNTVTTNTITPSSTDTSMILMFQEMTAESHTAILLHPWIRAHFVVSEKVPLPQSYYTLLLVDRRLRTRNWFRVPFKETMYRRDVVGVDVLIGENGSHIGEGGVKNMVGRERSQCVRVCTTHLESLGEPVGFELRPKQLACISRLLKEQDAMEIVGGMVGGDMNAISGVDNVSHKNADVDLRDVWEDNIESFGSSGPDVMSWDKDPTLGRSEGHTWGYQARNRWPPRRFDKFLYTGDLEMVALEEMEDCSGKVGRLGVGLRIKNGQWVSDHFGIAVGIKVPKSKSIKE